MKKGIETTPAETEMCPHGNFPNSCETCQNEKQETTKRIEFFLETCEQNIKENRITTSSIIELLENIVREARDKKIDLSEIDDIDTKIGQIKKEAPTSMARGYLRFLKLAREQGGQNMLLAWYQETKDLFDNTKNDIDPTVMEELDIELTEAKKDLEKNQ